MVLNTQSWSSTTCKGSFCALNYTSEDKPFHSFPGTSLSSLVDSIDLANKGTQRPRLKPTVAPQVGALNFTTKSPKEDSGVAIYRVINRKTDTTCILLKTDAVVEVTNQTNRLQCLLQNML